MIHLNARTDFSFMKGYGMADEWHERAKEIGASAMGIADVQSTWGHIPFSKAFTDVKLLLGVQTAVVSALTKEQKHATVTLIAKSDEGLASLYEAMSLASQQMYYRPRLTWKQIAELKGHCELIVNECSLGDFVDFEKVGFGYVGVGPRPGSLMYAINDGGFQAVAAPSPCYPSIAQRDAFELVTAISDGRRFGEGSGDGFHMMRRSEYEALLKGVNVHAKEEWFEAADQIAEECTASVPFATNIKPRVDDTLEVLARRGAARRGLDLEGVYGSRLRHELSVISDKKFEDYFLFVQDVVTWAKERMFVGPCRGSSGGSLVCFCLGITELDPIKYGTLFERFLDASRSDWPDIDIDFPDVKRDQVFTYLREKYGANHVARLGTISKFGGKSAINDTGKAHGVEYTVIRDVGRATESINVSLGVLFNNLPDDVKILVDNNPVLRDAAMIEGHARHHGVHAAGVVVTNEPVTNFGTLNKEGTISLDMKTAESINLLKLDALGLRTLSVIEDCCEQIDMDADALHLLDFTGLEFNRKGDQVDVFALFNKDHVTGIFQFEGTAVRSLMRQIHVEKFEDLCALTSLARPGPLVGGAAANWTQRRSGEVDYDYAHPALEAITSDTLGTIIYQEQAMQIVRSLGGFDDVEVNAFRRAVGKKDPEALGKFRDTFLEDAVASFYAENTKGVAVTDEEEKMQWDRATEQANELWDEMCEFGSYAFNKSHAVAYSMISYQCAYLKVIAPMEFAVAQLRNAASEDQGKALLRELTAEGHEVVPFDHKRSEADWSIQGGKLYGGFTAVKGIGKKTAEFFENARRLNPDGWLEKLTPAQYDKLTKPFNTPWDDLNRRGKMYAKYYDDPDSMGVRGPVLRLDQIPEEKGQYCFIGTLTRRQLRTKTDDKGKVLASKPTFLNLYFEDDTGDCGSTISRFKYEAIGAPLMDIPEAEGRDFLVRGTIINDGRKWFFIDKLKEISNE